MGGIVSFVVILAICLIGGRRLFNWMVEGCRESDTFANLLVIVGIASCAVIAIL